MTDLADRCEAESRADIGAKIKLGEERNRYTIQARNDRFLILTKPFNAQKTYIYTIVDLDRGVRGPCDLIFGLPCDVNTPESASEALAMLERGEMEVSYRRSRSVDLTPTEIASLRAHTQAVATGSG